MEDSYKMGETLNGESGLDINQEKQIIEDALSHLNLENATNATITLAMKDLGIQRCVTYMLFHLFSCFYLLFIL